MTPRASIYPGGQTAQHGLGGRPNGQPWKAFCPLCGLAGAPLDLRHVLGGECMQRGGDLGRAGARGHAAERRGRGAAAAG
eukprot:scaffold72117_cov33-Phaeocystis_antarctica.AAC.1